MGSQFQYQIMISKAIKVQDQDKRYTTQMNIVLNPQIHLDG